MRKFKFLGLICGLLLMPMFMTIINLSNYSNISKVDAVSSSWTEPVTITKSTTIENVTISNQNLNKSAYTLINSNVDSRFEVRFHNVTFENIVSSDYCSCVNIDGKDLNLAYAHVIFDNCIFINCESNNGYGGAIYGKGSNLEIQFNNCIVEGCKSYYGGFLYLDTTSYSYIKGTNTTIRDCVSTQDGGAIYINGRSKTSGLTFINNYTGGSGGGILLGNSASESRVSECQFFENKAYDYGGGIYVKSNCKGTIISGCTFYKNTQYYAKNVENEIYDYNTSEKNNCSFICENSDCSLSKHVYHYNSQMNNCTHCTLSSAHLSKDSDGKYHIASTLDWFKFYNDVKTKDFANETISFDANDIVAYKTIGIYSDSKPFRGTFEGNFHSIYYSVDTNLTSSSYVGLFSYLIGAKVSNFYIYGYVKGKSFVGGLAGELINTKIDNVINYAKILSNTGSSIGGITGQLDTNSVIINSINVGEVKGYKYVGGIAGEIDDNSCVYNCINEGAIFAENGDAGNITGLCTDINGRFYSYILNCYCTYQTIGVVGIGSNNNVKNCYFSGRDSELETLDYLNDGIDSPISIFGINVKTDEWLYWMFYEDKIQLNEKYKDTWYDTETKNIVEEYKPIPRDTNFYTGGDLTTGWYFVNKSINLGDLTKVIGDVHLIIKKDIKLYIGNCLYVNEGNTISLYTTENGVNDGFLETSGKADYPGIGAGYKEKCGTINVHGMHLFGYGGTCSAGIGTGTEGRGGTLNVYGGLVEGQGGLDASGIGGGWTSSGITTNVYGGKVVAKGGQPRVSTFVLPVVGTNGIGEGSYYEGYGHSPSGGVTNIYGGIVSAYAFNDETIEASAIRGTLLVDCCNAKYTTDGNPIGGYYDQQQITIDATSDEKHVYKLTHEKVWPKFNSDFELIEYGVKEYYECECGDCFENYINGELTNKITTTLDYWKKHNGRLETMPDEFVSLKNWIETYLFMKDDPHGEGRTCSSNYINAKTNLILLSSKTIQVFVNPEYDVTFLDARLRYEAWARANGDNNPYNAEVTGIQFLSGGNYLPFENLSNSIIIIITSMITLGTFMFVCTKKKENK